MLKEQTNLLFGIIVFTMIISSFFAMNDQISERALAQNKTGNNNMIDGKENASAMMVNKTAANSDVLMTKVRNMDNSSSSTGSDRTTQ